MVDETEIRKMIGGLLKLYLTGELRDIIEMEEVKSNEGNPLSAMDYSVGGNGIGGVGPKRSPVVQIRNKKNQAVYRKNQLITLQKMLKKAMDIISNSSNWERIIVLYYRDDYTIGQIANKMGYSKRSVEDKKKKALDKIAVLLNFKELDILEV
ncbi:sigma-70 family RNA polymerase sigma factor [Sporohalobacter salinus]|uniref:sigma-70 family RNA polymerase sigma factor n=1 Tax=Sporohalobacter salinus TaxID=1494606 RepID=UPI0019604F60|nr:sigma-70 family RNA polymerase sigma factor [Sporohalobacter salinus]MBM7623730.1 putative DNA-binding protein YlxM (UPF0122 family) [Sporohalobacter salinus]